MNTADFIIGFIHNTLGRKKQHGRIRVIDGEHCQLLVASAVSNGSPTGVVLLAIRLLSNISQFVFLTERVTYMSKAVRKQVRAVACQTLDNEILHENNANLLASGIVDTNTYYSVIEIGNNPYLFTHRAVRPTAAQLDGRHLGLTVDKVELLSHRVSTVEEALQLVAIPSDCRIIFGNIVVKPMPKDFVPPEPDKATRDLIIDPPCPLHYGYLLTECGPSGGMLLPKDKDALESPVTTREVAWVSAYSRYRDAVKSWEIMYPYRYDVLSIKKNVWSIGNTTTTGLIVVSPEGVYLSGTMNSVTESSKKETLDVWSKYIEAKKVYSVRGNI